MLSPFPFSDFCIVNIQARIIFDRERRKNSLNSEAFSRKCRNLVGGRRHSAFMLQFPDSAKAITNWALISWPLGPANPNYTVIWAHPDSSSGVETSQGRIIQTTSSSFSMRISQPQWLTPALPTSSFGEYKKVVGVISFLKSWISGLAYHPHLSLQTSSSSLHFIFTYWRSNRYPTILFLWRFPKECF